MTKAQPFVILSHRYFATWLLIRAHRGQPLSPHLSMSAGDRKKHSRVRFLSAIFMTFLSVARHKCRARYVRLEHKWRLREPDLVKTPLKRSARGRCSIYTSCRFFRAKISRHLNFSFNFILWISQILFVVSCIYSSWNPIIYETKSDSKFIRLYSIKYNIDMFKFVSMIYIRKYFYVWPLNFIRYI